MTPIRRKEAEPIGRKWETETVLTSNDIGTYKPEDEILSQIWDGKHLFVLKPGENPQFLENEALDCANGLIAEGKHVKIVKTKDGDYFVCYRRP